MFLLQERGYVLGDLAFKRLVESKRSELLRHAGADASRRVASETNTTPSSKMLTQSPAQFASPSRVLPIPAGPVSVSRRTPSLLSMVKACVISCSRPISDVGGRGNRDGERVSTAVADHLWPYHRQEQGTLLCSQVQSGHQQLERVVTRDAIDAALKISDGASAKIGASSQCLLRQTCCCPIAPE